MSEATTVSNDKPSIAETYGEILPHGVAKLISFAELMPNDVVVDLGSGKGKLVQQVFLSSPVQEVRGIEINPVLHQEARRLQANTYRDYPALCQPPRRLMLLLGDFLKTGVLEGATVVVIGSPCFGPSMLNRLSALIEVSTSVRAVFSLRPLLLLKRLRFKKVFRVECSWDSAQCYWYGLPPP